MRRPCPRRALPWLLFPFLAACADTSPSDDPALVIVSLVVAEGAPVARGQTGPADRANSLAIAGSNGTLVLEELSLVVDRVQLIAADGQRVDAQAGPRLVDLPVDEVPVQVAGRLVAPGEYAALSLTVRSLVPAERTEGPEPVTSGVAPRERFPAWPDEASLRVVGFFEPAGGSDARHFVAYLTAEAERTLDFPSPLVVGGKDAATGIIVEVDPGAWFDTGDGTVPDLSVGGRSATGKLLDLEIPMEDGFVHADLDR